jgi:hypothetical protein
MLAMSLCAIGRSAYKKSYMRAETTACGLYIGYCTSDACEMYARVMTVRVGREPSIGKRRRGFMHKLSVSYTRTVCDLVMWKEAVTHM